jgi:hypothetical protein
MEMSPWNNPADPRFTGHFNPDGQKSPSSSDEITPGMLIAIGIFAVVIVLNLLTSI